METKKPYSQYTFEDAKDFIHENNILGWNELMKTAYGLYSKAKKENWHLFPKKYTQYNFEDIKELIKREKIVSRAELGRKYPGLSQKAYKNNWMNDLFPDNNIKGYSQYSFEKADELVRSNGIRSRTEFKKMYPGLGVKADKEGWMDIWFPDGSKHCSKGFSNYTFHQAKKYIEDNNISSRNELQNKSQSLYKRLQNMIDEKTGLQWVDILFPIKKPYLHYTIEECKEFVERRGYKNLGSLLKEYPTLARHITEMGWKKDVFPNSTEYTNPTDITAFVKEFLANWDEALHYPNVILMKLAESFGDTSILNKLVKKIATTDPGSIERKELLEEMQDKMVDNEGITRKEIEQIIKMSQGMEDNATDDPVSAMERLMNMEDVEDDNGDINAETLGRQVDMAQRALNNKLLDNKNCGDIVLTIKNVFLHRMLCLWADGDDNVTEKMMDKLFVES